MNKSSTVSQNGDFKPAYMRSRRFLGIEFAPLVIPLHRRLQTLMVINWFFTILVAPVICVLIIAVLLLSPLAPISGIYLGWLLLYDRNTPSQGGRRVEFVRRLKMWRYFRDYFPVRLVKTAELDPSGNYLIGYHPHGIIGCGAFCNFATEATGFSQLFPGIRPHLLTLAGNFYWPLLRGYIMAFGICDVSRASVRWITTRQGAGNAAVIAVGGAEEALESHPGTYRLKLKTRKGFVRMALQTGASLVPCFSFGENDVYVQAENPQGSKIRKFQELFKHMFKISPPFFHGRGVFNYTFGFMPYRKPITTVVGRPITVEKVECPTTEKINDLHNAYMSELGRLFDEHKEQFGISPQKHLEFI